MKRFYRAKHSKGLEEEVQESKNGHGFQFNKICFVAGYPGELPKEKNGGARRKFAKRYQDPILLTWPTSFPGPFSKLGKRPWERGCVLGGTGVNDTIKFADGQISLVMICWHNTL